MFGLNIYTGDLMIGYIILAVGIILIIVGVIVITSPAAQATSQTSNTLPNYISNAFGSAVAGTIILIIGFGVAALGGWILSHP
jgi:hypothetical protein